MAKPNVAKVVHLYKEQQGRLTYREFADALTEALGKHDSVSYNAVAFWGMGRYNPDYWMLVHLVTFNSSWPGDFARDCLAVMKPEIWHPTEAFASDN